MTLPAHSLSLAMARRLIRRPGDKLVRRASARARTCPASIALGVSLAALCFVALIKTSNFLACGSHTRAHSTRQVIDSFCTQRFVAHVLACSGHRRPAPANPSRQARARVLMRIFAAARARVQEFGGGGARALPVDHERRVIDQREKRAQTLAFNQFVRAV